MVVHFADLGVRPTHRFCVLDFGSFVTNSCDAVPMIALEDMLLHGRHSTTAAVQSKLKYSLVEHGYVLLTVQHEKVTAVIRSMRSSLHTDVFPATATTANAGMLQTSSTTYISERGVPMYKLGYEMCEDGVREVFRVAAGSPETVCWGKACSQSSWVRGLGLLRHVSDTALDILLLSTDGTKRKRRPHSGRAAWLKMDMETKEERSGDFSVLYAMHYFNSNRVEVEPGIAVKAHVDPSLLVIEPFLCPQTTGLQVWDRINDRWMDCDGPTSPLRTAFDGEVMLLFAGKAISCVVPEIEPTLHRVVTGDQSRRTVIYEQKYAEFYPPPSFD